MTRMGENIVYLQSGLVMTAGYALGANWPWPVFALTVLAGAAFSGVIMSKMREDGDADR